MTDPGRSAEELFGEALELPPEGRSAFLDQMCGHDPELRLVLEQLLLEDARAGSFLAGPLLTPPKDEHTSAGTFQVKQRLTAGTKVGRYAIVEPLGAGAMGVLYKAKDPELNRCGTRYRPVWPSP
jgi:hypothetical protein